MKTPTAYHNRHRRTLARLQVLEEQVATQALALRDERWAHARTRAGNTRLRVVNHTLTRAAARRAQTARIKP